MGFLNKKYETPYHYKPIGKKGQKAVFYTMLVLLIGVSFYILSFYL
jgi:hypothetical protein